jgi:hypothetical protein
VTHADLLEIKQALLKYKNLNKLKFGKIIFVRSQLCRNFNIAELHITIRLANAAIFFLVLSLIK